MFLPLVPPTPPISREPASFLHFSEDPEVYSDDDAVAKAKQMTVTVLIQMTTARLPLER